MEVPRYRYEELVRMVRAFADARTINDDLRIFNAQRRARILVKRITKIKKNE